MIYPLLELDMKIPTGSAKAVSSTWDKIHDVPPSCVFITVLYPPEANPSDGERKCRSEMILPCGSGFRQVHWAEAPIVQNAEKIKSINLILILIRK
jgi:hypothetical protein